MDQSRMPLLEQWKDLRDRSPLISGFGTPVFPEGLTPDFWRLPGEKMFSCDLTEAEGLDDLHHPAGAILEAEQLAAELYGSRRCWFLVNGTTCGNEAMILSAVGPGEKIMVPRNAHKSAMMGADLSGAVPVWIMPEYCGEWGVFGGIRPETVEEGFRREPDCRAVFLVSPTYYGICSDIQAIADICHAHGAMLLVDEAHGGHLYFSEQYPPELCSRGRICVPRAPTKPREAWTQSSLLHLQGNLADPERVDENLKLVMSTSPSYLLMASLDAARQQLALRGKEMMEEAARMAPAGRRASGADRRIPGHGAKTSPEPAGSAGWIRPGWFFPPGIWGLPAMSCRNGCTERRESAWRWQTMRM